MVREFKGFIRLAGMTNVRTDPFQPQSNGKLERRNSNLEEAWIRRALARQYAV